MQAGRKAEKTIAPMRRMADTDALMEPLASTAIPAAETQPRVARLERNGLGQLVAHLEGTAEPVTDVVAARCFPWTLPETYVSLRTREGKEIALLKTLAELDEASRAVLEAELHDKVFNPKIKRITAHARDFGITSITAETDRGTATFEIRTRDDIRMLSATRIVFRDADGITYEVADLTALDPVSRGFVEEYL